MVQNLHVGCHIPEVKQIHLIKFLAYCVAELIENLKATRLKTAEANYSTVNPYDFNHLLIIIVIFTPHGPVFFVSLVGIILEILS